MKFIDENAVRGLLEMKDLIPAMATALKDLSSGKAVQPVRTIVPVPDHKGFLGSMPAYNGALGAKLVTFYPHNEGIHTHHGVIVLFRPDTGEPIAVIDGRLITEMRTAAVSAAATDILARPDASVLAILGSGVQAGSHLESIGLVRELTDVRVWSPRNASTFAASHPVVRVAETAQDAVRGADMIVVATSSETPVLSGDWLSPGSHVNAIGANRPTWRELDDEALAVSKIFVESREAAMSESGDIIAAGRIDAEIGEIVDGKMPGRQNVDEITLFKSLGAAVEDIAAADLVLNRFLQNNDC